MDIRVRTIGRHSQGYDLAVLLPELCVRGEIQMDVEKKLDRILSMLKDIDRKLDEIHDDVERLHA